MSNSSYERDSYIRLLICGAVAIFVAAKIGKFLGNIMGNFNYRLSRLEDKDLLRDTEESIK